MYVLYSSIHGNNLFIKLTTNFNLQVCIVCFGITFQKDHIFKRTFIATEQIIPIFRKYFFLSTRHNTDFPRAAFFSTEQITIFHEAFFEKLTKRYWFSRSTSIATEQITIFHEALYEYQRTYRLFPGRYPPSNRYLSQQ